MFGRNLPPTGNPIVLTYGEQLQDWPQNYHPILVNSGTAALGLALLAARLRHPDIAAPEVVLPGYGCPDLVAAARFAGVRAVLADIGDSDPAYDAGSLRQVLNENTVAVVAINFLGIAERLDDLDDVCKLWPRIALIEDNAQWFPESFPDVALKGDAVCLSFGRGKPMSLLGGGALLLREGSFADAVLAALNDTIDAAPGPGWFKANKVWFYNLLLSNRRLYGAINRIPLLGLGQTVFKPLAAATALDKWRQDLMLANIDLYRARPQFAADFLSEKMPSARNLPVQLAQRRARLLRYPVLCNERAERDELLARLSVAGLGASALYQRIMPEVKGVGDQVDVRVPLEGACLFADRLLTLPVHAGVTKRDMEQMLEIIR